MDLTGDGRGQSIQIGAVLLFGVLIILFTTYQAFVVPNQNREVEFNHNQRVEGDMVELRNTILETKTTGEDGYATVELGTEFPARLLALNPSPPSGSLSTTEPRPIVIEQNGNDITTDVCPGTDIQTRFIEYNPSYSVYDSAGTIRYENSLLYHQFSDDSVLMTSQQLVQGDTIQITPLSGSLNKGGGDTVAIESKAGLLTSSQKNDLNVTIPTELSRDRWETALEGEVDPGNITVSNGNLTLTLSGEYTVNCSPVGLGEAPQSGERGSDRDDITPANPGDIRLTDSSASGSTVTVTFNNTGATNNFTEARIDFYRNTGSGKGSKPTSADVYVDSTNNARRASLDIRGDYESFTPKIELQGGGSETDVVFEFDANGGGQSWFVVSFQLETGESALYIVPAS
ncbi:hypothetical protein [Salinibaculum rarum]|uniref:hypothetical protein n=1 Tax=Salinibaculum rarum TaxID=3058903 RepID=UPI00266058BA|nr:hypothetical protein [Salinibaculum sp. KK48]